MEFNAGHRTAQPREGRGQYVAKTGGCGTDKDYFATEVFGCGRLSEYLRERIRLERAGTTDQGHGTVLIPDIDIGRRIPGLRILWSNTACGQRKAWPELVPEAIKQVKTSGNAVAVQFHMSMAQTGGR